MSDSKFTLGEWQEAPIRPFNLEAEYRSQVEPLVDKIVDLCKELGLPISLRIFYAQSDMGCAGRTVCNLPEDVTLVPPEALMLAMVDKPNLEGMQMMQAVVLATMAKINAHFQAQQQTKH